MNGLRTLIIEIGHLVGLSIPIVMGTALLGFFWGLAMFIFQSGDEKKVEEGKRIMKWGIIALFVMVSIWGIVRFMATSLELGQGGIIQIETIPSGGH